MHDAVGVEDCPAVPGGRDIAAERAIDDLGVAQRAQAAAHVSSRVAADRAALDRQLRIEEAIDSAAIDLIGGVAAHGAVDQLQRAAVAVIDAAAALPEFIAAAGNATIRDQDMIKRQLAVVQNATG